MELGEAIRRRRMCRNFSDRPVSRGTIDGLLDKARRAPSAGHTQGWAFLVLEGPEQTGRFWEVGADPGWAGDPRGAGLVRAPVIVVPLFSTKAYLDRYSEPDKLSAAMTAAESWPAPFWVVDVSFATMLLLLGAVEEGLGALFFGLHANPDGLRAEFAVPPEWQPIGGVALGWPSEDGDGPPGSATRGRREWDEVVHRGGW